MEAPAWACARGKVTTHDEALDEALAEIDANGGRLFPDATSEARAIIDLDVLDPEVAVRRHAL